MNAMIVDVVRAILIASIEGEREVQINFKEDNDIPVIERVVELAERILKISNPDFDFNEGLEKACKSKTITQKIDLNIIFSYMGNLEKIIEKLSEDDSGFDTVLIIISTMYALEILMGFNWRNAKNYVILF